MQTLLFEPRIPPSRVEIAIGTNLVQTQALVDLCKGKQIAILTDVAIAKTYGKSLQDLLGGKLFPIASREETKTRKTKEEIEDTLLKNQFGKNTLIVALGGGILCDIAAFVASTYLRGVEILLIPTTLLAMIDAAIGGKTGVNTPFGKNLIGTFYNPKAVYVDLSYLSTLPEPEWLNGLAEILKYGLVFDSSIWEFCEAHVNDWKNPKLLETLILSSLKTLIKILEQDPFEQTGFRRILNFGHTVGHALESVSHYKIPHGQAIAFGCIAESYLSHKHGYLSQSAFDRIESLYKKFAFPLQLPSSFQKKPFLDAMQHDKKTKDGKVRSVLIDEIGHAVAFDGHYCCPIEPSKLVDWLQKTYG